jgi:signal transduction histidine kinase
MMRSLRARAIVAAVALSTFVVCLGSVALYLSLDRIARERFDETLTERHARVVVALFDVGPDAGLLNESLADAAYERPYSGRYWQLTGPDGLVLTSPSLFDFSLPSRSGPRSDFSDIDTLAGALRVLSRSVTLEDGQVWQVTVAESLERLQVERGQIRRSLGLAFVMLILGGLIGSVLHVATVLRPLEQLRQDILSRWERSETLRPGDYPSEVAPLVEDINTLMSRNHEIIERSRRQGADLAHALKTPSAVLRNEIDTLGLSEAGRERAREALDHIDAQVTRSLARIRAGNIGSSSQAPTPVAEVFARLARLFQNMPGPNAPRIDARADPGLTIAMDRQDLEEIVGNVLENACKWARTSVSARAEPQAGDIVIRIEDDGPGIPEELRQTAMRSGARLDTSHPGSGLGLAIVCDLVEAYGGRVALSKSGEYGGLQVTLSLPRTYRPR